MVWMGLTAVRADEGPAGYQENLKRQSVAVVYSRVDAPLAEKIADYSLWLSRIGKRDASLQLSRLARREFGSGFVVEYNHQLVVLTGSHVVGAGRTADVAFIRRDDTLRFDGCTCLCQNTHEDIAALLLPMEARGQVMPLMRIHARLTDDDEVYTAAYTPLADRPSWQFGRYSRHAGPTGPGSSGAPLLILTDEGYAAAGMQSLQMYEGEAVHTAVPMVEVEKTLQRTGDNDMQRYLRVVDTMSVEQYAKRYNAVPQTVRDRQDELFARGYVPEGLALVVQYTDSAAVKTKREKTSLKEREQFDKASVPHLAKKKKKKHAARAMYGIDRDLEQAQSMYLSSTMLFPSKTMCLAGLGYHYSVANYMRTGAFLGFAMRGVGSDSPEYGMNVTINIGAQLPLMLGRVELIPYLTPDFGISIVPKDRNALMNYGMIAGLEVMVPFTDNALVFGLDYNLQGLGNLRREAPSLNEGAVHGVGVHLGIAF